MFIWISLVLNLLSLIFKGPFDNPFSRALHKQYKQYIVAILSCIAD